MSVDNERNGERMRELLSEHADRALAGTPELSADDIIRRSRRRRAPRQVAVGGVSALAVAGLLIVAVPAVTNSGLFGAPSAIESASIMSGEERYDSGAPEAPESDREILHTVPAACEEQTAPPASSYQGLAVSLTAQAVPITDTEWQIDSVVDLTNSHSTESRSMGIAGVSIVLAQNGLSVAHGDWHPTEVFPQYETLAPGETVTLPVSVILRWCDGVVRSGEFELTVGVTSSRYEADLISEPVRLRIP